MNFKQLRAFKEVMETGSISEAARRLFRSQPAISALIVSLENDLELKLFTRQGMRLKPLPEAHYLLKEASVILEHLENTRSTMKSVRNVEQGLLRIVCMPGPSVFLMPDFIERFLNGRDAIKVSLISKTSAQVEQLVSAQQYDIGFGDPMLTTISNNSLVEHEIHEFECLCAMRYDDPLAAREFITPADLHAKPMATLYPEHSTYVQTRAAFHTANAAFVSRFEAQYFIPLLTFIERGLAYSLIDRLSVEGYRLNNHRNSGEIVFRPFYPRINLTTSIMTPVHANASLLGLEFHTAFTKLLEDIKTRPF